MGSIGRDRWWWSWFSSNRRITTAFPMGQENFLCTSLRSSKNFGDNGRLKGEGVNSVLIKS
jgi:hypothetical protein